MSIKDVLSFTFENPMFIIKKLGGSLLITTLHYLVSTCSYYTRCILIFQWPKNMVPSSPSYNNEAPSLHTHIAISQSIIYVYISQELLKLRKKITSTVQVLTHLKEKLQFVQAENHVQQGVLHEVEETAAKVSNIVFST